MTRRERVFLLKKAASQGMARAWALLPAVLFCFMVLAGTVQAGITVQPGYKAEVFVENLDMPKGLTFNSDDELFLIESGKYRILKVSPDGTVQIHAENGPGAPLDFHSWYIGTHPTKMDFDKDGNLYAGAVGGYSNPYNPYRDLLDTVFRIAPDGRVASIARQIFSPNIFYDIAGLAIGPDGCLYIADTWSPRDILRVDLATNTSTRFATNVSGGLDLLFDDSGTLYACMGVNNGKQNIYQFAPDGTRSLFTDAVANPISIDWGPEGDLYVLDSAKNTIYSVNLVSKAVTTFASGFHYPLDIAFDSKGNLYVAEPCLGDLTSRTNPVPACYGHVVKISKSNQPPVAEAGADQTVECAVPDGATVVLDASGSSDPDGNGLTYTWSWGAGGAASGEKPTLILPLGTTVVTVTVDDGQGGTATDTVSVTVRDTTAPVTLLRSMGGIPGNNGWYQSGITADLYATDACSGVAEVRYAVDSGTETGVPGSSAPVTVAHDGIHRIVYYARDNAGNSETPHHALTVMIDTAAPLISTVLSKLPNPPGWNNTDVTVTFACSDAGSGVASCPAAQTVAAEGRDQEVIGTARDHAGLQATASVRLNIDKTAPVTSALLTGTLGAACYSSDVTVILSAADNLSGVASTAYRVNGGPWLASAGPIALSAEGLYALSYLSIDRADNAETAKTIGFTVDKTAPEAVIRFDAAAKDIKVVNSETGSEAGYLVLPSWHEKEDGEDDDRDDHRDKDRGHGDKDAGQGKELRQYTLQDCANNTTVLTVEHKKEGHEAQVRVISMQYNDTPVIKAARNKIQAEYAAKKDGTIRELEQKIQVKKQFAIEAKFRVQKDTTVIEAKVRGEKEQKEARPGMTILELLTDKGGLNYRY